jgi:hypothetical protein
MRWNKIQKGNCGQWHGRAEAYITRNHLGGVTLGVTPTTQGRVACNATSCRQIHTQTKEIEMDVQNEILDYLGNQATIETLHDDFGGLDETEILAKLNEWFPTEENEELAKRIFEYISSYDE